MPYVVYRVFVYKNDVIKRSRIIKFNVFIVHCVHHNDMYRYRTISIIIIYRMFSNQNKWYVVVWWEKNESYSPKIYRTIVTTTTTEYIAFLCWWLFVLGINKFSLLRMCGASRLVRSKLGSYSFIKTMKYYLSFRTLSVGTTYLLMVWPDFVVAFLFLTDFEKKNSFRNVHKWHAGKEMQGWSCETRHALGIEIENMWTWNVNGRYKILNLS